MPTNHDIAQHIITQTKALGADHCELLFTQSEHTSLSIRNQHLEHHEHANSMALGIRVIVGQKQACVSTSSFGKDHLTHLSQQMMDMAHASPEHPHLCVADPSSYASSYIDLDIYDTHSLPQDDLRDLALEAEQHATQTSGITNSEGASINHSQSTHHWLTSSGFDQTVKGSFWSLYVSVLAGHDDHMQRDYAGYNRRYFSDLPSPKTIGEEAAKRTLKKHNPKIPPTATMPVVFDPRVGDDILGHIASGINGNAIAKGTSIFASHLSKPLFNKNISIILDPHLPKGHGSRWFDGEYQPSQKLACVDDGVLHHWLLDLTSAKQLGMQTNGCASRSLSSPPSPSVSNLYIKPSTISPQSLMEDIQQGVYITETFGMGFNLITGDYSQGACGFMIENGEITYPIEQCTIAGNIIDMCSCLHVADDLVFNGRINTPTLRIDQMTVAGN